MDIYSHDGTKYSTKHYITNDIRYIISIEENRECDVLDVEKTEHHTWGVSENELFPDEMLETLSKYCDSLRVFEWAYFSIYNDLNLEKRGFTKLNNEVFDAYIMDLTPFQNTQNSLWEWLQ